MPDDWPCSSLPDVRPRTIRFDDATWQAAEEESRLRGLDSTAEYVRQSVVRIIAVDRTVRAIQAGVDPATLQDPEALKAMIDQFREWMASQRREGG